MVIYHRNSHKAAVVGCKVSLVEKCNSVYLVTREAAEDIFMSQDAPYLETSQDVVKSDSSVN